MGSHAGHAGVMNRLRHFWCGLHGHDALLQFEHDRMFLRCVSCGHETPGWALDETRPVTTARVEPQKPMLVRAPLISARRVA
jgi:hypothetical protein